MRGLEWKWIRVSVIEVDERKNEMGIDGNEWSWNNDANRHGNEEQAVMRVMDVKQNGKEDGIMNKSV